MAPDIDECAYDCSYHVAEEAVGGYFEVPAAFVAVSVPAGFAEVAYIGLYVGVELGEGCEVAAPYDESGGFVHCIEVERGGGFPCKLARKGVLACGGEVAVCAACGVETRVCVVFYTPYGVNGYVASAEAVEGFQHRGRWRSGVVEVGYHAACVYAGVGAPRACYGHGASRYGGECFFYYLLHAYVARLYLPAVEWLAPV